MEQNRFGKFTCATLALVIKVLQYLVTLRRKALPRRNVNIHFARFGAITNFRLNHYFHLRLVTAVDTKLTEVGSF